MIKLTIETSTNQENRFFDKSTILIGSALSEADVNLPPPAEPIHVKIVKQERGIFGINYANDPFASVNGQPFWKVLLSSGDIIEITGVKIHVHYEPQESKESPILESLSSQALAERIDLKITCGSCSKAQNENEGSFEEFPKSDSELEGPDWDSIDFSEIERDIETAAAGCCPHENTEEAPRLSLPRNFTSIKDDHLSETGEENETWYPENNIPDQEKQAPAKKSRFLRSWLFLLVIAIFAGLSGGVLEYENISKKTHEEEMQAAQGISDLAMALIHAQIFHQKPQNQNWSDPDFLKTNLATVLPNQQSAAKMHDIQEYFSKNFYSLRIYTSADLSRFLLIAQPAPSLSQWLIPKAAILVDSQSMEIRKIKDLRNLNRLLAVADSLEKDHANEILSFIKHEELIPLAYLAKALNSPDFLPPQPLLEEQTGSSNLIYNAPRYHRFGEKLVEAALKLQANLGNSQDILILKKEVQALAKLPNLIIYDPKGKLSAEKTLQGILAFSDNAARPLIGWLSFNDLGVLVGGVLIENQDTLLKEGSQIAFEEQEKDDEIEEAELPSLQSNDPALFNDPLYTHLSHLKASFQEALSPIAQELSDLLQAELHSPSMDFQHQFSDLSAKLLQVESEQTKIIKNALSQLSTEYNFLSVTQFMTIVKSTELVGLIEQRPDPTDEMAYGDELNTLLSQLDRCSDLVELESLISKSEYLLLTEHVSFEKLTSLQNSIRKKAFPVIEKLLFSPNHSLKKEEITPAMEEKLMQILNYSWLIEPDERSFLLAEYSLLTN